MGFLLDNCTLRPYNKEVINSCELFECGIEDLNDFFANDAEDYSSQLLGKTYCFTLDDNPKIVVCAFTISNDSIKTTTLPGSRKKKVIENVPRKKHMRSYPAVLIGRLGVHKEYRRINNEKIGKQLMDFIKSWFIDGANKTGCRFIVVDSYNNPRPLKYYENNGFKFLFSSEKQEKEFTGVLESEALKTRLMFFDLIVLKK
ncbi:GNAT family N-acetyltransferase [Galbibacter sp. PAP.153]|uniref:GNAT family N-acetyltransferase n=1 Tax=Galbibacter sp. PAP.153 TaxID=3104623 RepID=UPI00300BDB00